MPYANIYWIKLKLETLNDKRFLFDLDDSQKLLFLGLLMLAGATKNSIPDDVNYLKNRLNLDENTEKIAQNLQKIYSVFPKTLCVNGHIKFKNFNELHNPTGNSKGTPTELQRTHRVDKSRVDKIRHAYILFKRHSIGNYTSNDFARTGKAIVELINRAKDNDALVLEALEWISEQKFEWTLETLNKKWVDFMAYKQSKPQVRKI